MMTKNLGPSYFCPSNPLFWCDQTFNGYEYVLKYTRFVVSVKKWGGQVARSDKFWTRLLRSVGNQRKSVNERRFQKTGAIRRSSQLSALWKVQCYYSIMSREWMSVDFPLMSKLLAYIKSTQERRWSNEYRQLWGDCYLVAPWVFIRWVPLCKSRQFTDLMASSSPSGFFVTAAGRLYETSSATG